MYEAGVRDDVLQGVTDLPCVRLAATLLAMPIGKSGLPVER